MGIGPECQSDLVVVFALGTDLTTMLLSRLVSDPDIILDLGIWLSTRVHVRLLSPMHTHRLPTSMLRCSDSRSFPADVVSATLVLAYNPASVKCKWPALLESKPTL